MDDSSDSDDSSGVDDSDSDSAEQCDVVWAKAGRGVWGLCHVFENALYLTRDLMKDSCPINSVRPQGAGAGLGCHFCPCQEQPLAQGACSTFRMKLDGSKGFYSESAKWKPLSCCALNGMGVLCQGMCYRHFTRLSRAPNTVSNEHYQFGPYSLRT